MPVTIGDDLDPASARAEGERYRHGRPQRRVTAARAANEVDASSADAVPTRATKRALEANPAWTTELLAAVRARTDDELKRDALAILAYQTIGRYGVHKIARLMGQTPWWVKTTLRVARERSLVDDVLSAARADIDHDIVPEAVKSLGALVKARDVKAVLGTLTGTGVLKADGSSEAPRSMALTVNIVAPVAGAAVTVVDPTNIVGAPRELPPTEP